MTLAKRVLKYHGILILVVVTGNAIREVFVKGEKLRKGKTQENLLAWQLVRSRGQLRNVYTVLQEA
jgi:hypothetical protein